MKSHTTYQGLCAVFAGAVSSCGGLGGGTPQTCLASTVTYAGSKSGTAYIKILSDDGGMSFSIAGPEPSIQALMFVENGARSCFGFGSRPDIPFTGAVWIDASGAEAANCSPSVLSPQCQPSATDPQAQQTGLLKIGQLTQIRFDVVDPP